MLKRRTTIVAFILVAALTLGIGYAALTDTLSITGSANFNASDAQDAFEEDVYFSKAVASADRCTAVVNADKDTATMTVLDSVFTQVGDEVIATFTVKSDSDLTLNVLQPTITNTGNTDTADHFTVATNWKTGDSIAANGTYDLTVTVRLIKTPTTDAGASINFTVTFNVESQN